MKKINARGWWAVISVAQDIGDSFMVLDCFSVVHRDGQQQIVIRPEKHCWQDQHFDTLVEKPIYPVCVPMPIGGW